MQVTVFGANGKVGSLVVAELLKRDYSVAAFAHNDHKLARHPKLKIIQGDIYNFEDVRSAITGSEAVISALGSWGTPEKDILSQGMKNIIPAMDEAGIKRIISLTGAGACDNETPGLVQKISRNLIKLAAHKILEDGEQHIALLRKSQLDWTVIRSPVMNEKADRKYLLSLDFPAPWATIRRQTVVEAMVNQLNDTTWNKKSPFIRRS
jgi:putative NADH-flavin reductase